MFCEQCRATFAALDLSDESLTHRAVRLDEAQPACRCEAVSVSKHSPGIVVDSEILIRILVAPQHMGGKGRPRAAALSDSERLGLSVLRQDHAKDNEIRSVAERLIARARTNHNHKAGVFGVLLIECIIVRQLTRIEQEDCCYCVYDTALVDNPGHAEIFQQVAGIEEAVRDDRRQRLFAKIKDSFVPVAVYRGGLLADLAPATI